MRLSLIFEFCIAFSGTIWFSIEDKIILAGRVEQRLVVSFHELEPE